MLYLILAEFTMAYSTIDSNYKIFNPQVLFLYVSSTSIRSTFLRRESRKIELFGFKEIRSAFAIFPEFILKQ